MQTLYDEPRGTVRYDITGAHRGGTDHSRLLLDKIQASPDARIPDVGLRDRRADRTQGLARLFERQGVSVTLHHEEAPLESEATIQVLAIDDAKRVARVPAQPVRNQLLELGILVAAPIVEGVGGPVLGFGATLTPAAKDATQKARALLEPIAEMVPERQSSRNMSASIVNSVQMKSTRHRVHDRLTDSSLDYLEHGTASHELFVADGLTRDVYPLEVVETRRATRRQDLRDLVTHEILPQLMLAEDRAGVAFYDRNDPWLYVVLGRSTGSRWRTVNVIELPPRVLEPTVVNLGSREMRGTQNLEAAASPMFATD